MGGFLSQSSARPLVVRHHAGVVSLAEVHAFEVFALRVPGVAAKPYPVDAEGTLPP
jgi:hypothetical protein